MTASQPASQPDLVMCGYVKLPGGCVITKLVCFALLGILFPHRSVGQLIEGLKINRCDVFN